MNWEILGLQKMFQKNIQKKVSELNNIFQKMA